MKKEIKAIVGGREVVIDIWGTGICIGIEGYGEMDADEDHSRPIMIDFFYSHPEVIVWGDIQQEDPTHRISLEGAHESHRVD